MSVRFLVAWSLLLYCFSCNPTAVYREAIKLPKEGWSQSQPVSFQWQINDTSALYSIELRVSHRAELKYQNIYLRCLSKNPDQASKTQLLSLELLSANGKPNGKCRFGNCLAEIPLQENVQFQTTGKYELQLVQYSRDTVYTGIDKIELRVIKHR